MSAVVVVINGVVASKALLLRMAWYSAVAHRIGLSHFTALETEENHEIPILCRRLPGRHSNVVIFPLRQLLIG